MSTIATIARKKTEQSLHVIRDTKCFLSLFIQFVAKIRSVNTKNKKSLRFVFEIA